MLRGRHQVSQEPERSKALEIGEARGELMAVQDRDPGRQNLLARQPPVIETISDWGGVSTPLEGLCICCWSAGLQIPAAHSCISKAISRIGFPYSDTKRGSLLQKGRIMDSTGAADGNTRRAI